MPDTKIADCGHEYASEGIGTGYARLRSETDTPDGKTLPKDATVCYPCADAMQIAELADGRTSVYAYLSTDGKKVTTWTGGTLMSVKWLSDADIRYTPTGGRHERFYLDAKDVHGKVWHGIGPGRGMYVRMRLAKNQN